MPTKAKITTEMVINAGFNLVKENGWEGVNARKVANYLGCSTQPIYSCFLNMESLKQEIIKKATSVYDEYIKNYSSVKTDKKYLQFGLAYIMFAKQEKNLFKLLFMRDRQNEVVSQKMQDNNLDLILTTISEKLKISKEKAYNIHLHMWVFTHGIASMIATNYVNFTFEQIEGLLINQFNLVQQNLNKENN